jgi:hypothetical protein
MRVDGKQEVGRGGGEGGAERSCTEGKELRVGRQGGWGEAGTESIVFSWLIGCRRVRPRSGASSIGWPAPQRLTAHSPLANHQQRWLVNSHEKGRCQLAPGRSRDCLLGLFYITY